MSDLAVISNQFGTLSYYIGFERVNRIMSLVSNLDVLHLRSTAVNFQL